jgi:Caspase domain
MLRRTGMISTASASLLAITMLWASPASAEKRVAIAIGIDAYDNLKAEQQLRKAVNDSRSAGDAFSSVGFEVIRAENVRRLEFNRAWQRFLNRIDPGDTVAVYFAGHGVEIAGSNFLLARDVPQVASGEDDLLKGEAIGLSRLLDDLRGRRPKVSVLILDACRDNPFPQPGGRSVGGSRGLTRVDAPEGTFVMFSAGTGEAALDRLSDADGDSNSVYTRRLLPLITQPGLSLPDLAQEVRRQVRELAATVKHRQTPAYYDEVVGRFCLANCEGGAAPAQIALGDPIAPAAPASPPPQAAVADAPNEALPAELPIRPEVLRVIETHPFFANAPPVSVGAYNIATTMSSSTTGAGTMTSEYNDNTSVRWLRRGLIRQDLSQNYTVNNSGAVGRYVTQSSSVSAANGSFNLSYRMTNTSGRTRMTTTSEVIRIENMKGHMFPVVLGNKFSFDVTSRWKSSAVAGSESTSKYSCEVTKRYEAKNFHANLTGAAHLLTCNVQTIEKKDNSIRNSQTREMFFDALGIWLTVDPVSPREQIVMNNETTVTGRYTTISNGTYTLKSFMLAR